MVGTPQPTDIIGALAEDTIKNLKTVNEEVLPLFKDAVTKILGEMSAEDAL